MIDVELGELALSFNKEQVVFNVFKATKYSQFYEVSKMLKSLKKKKTSKSELRVRHRVIWRNFGIKGLLGVFMGKASWSYIIQRLYEDGSVVVKDPRDLKVFVVKSKEPRAFLVTDKASLMVSLVLAEP